MERANSRHHLFFPEAEHELRPEMLEIRQTRSFIPKITRTEHDAFHKEVAIVPALGHNTLRAVSRIWTPEFETYRDIEGFCLAVEQANRHPKAHRIEIALAQLTIQALIMQRDLLKEIGFKNER